MAYSEKVIDHYNEPRNVGSLDKNDDATKQIKKVKRLFNNILSNNEKKPKWEPTSIKSSPFLL